MYGDSFYQAFKDALKFFDLAWGDMGKIVVRAETGKVIFTYEGREVAIHV